MSKLKAAPGSTLLTFFYCLPAAIAIGLVLNSYFHRTEKVGCFIQTQRNTVIETYKAVHKGDTHAKASSAELAKLVTEHDALSHLMKEKDKDGKDITTVSVQTRQLLHFFIRYYSDMPTSTINRLWTDIGQNKKVATQQSAQDTNTPLDNHYQCTNSNVHVDADIKQAMFSIWLSNSSVLAILAILPFLLLGSHMNFSSKMDLDYATRKAIVNYSWWMKFLIGFILAYGWIYLLNPHGRGAGTLEQYLIRVDLYQADTIPTLLKSGIYQPIIAGFLGWYLYMLTYFFSKVFSHDVLSTNVYGLMFQKLLFTYGVALILPSLQSTNNLAAGVDTSIVMAFLIGFFPMSAFSMLKDTGLKMLHGSKGEKGQLQELPGIARWQILRLEEEGIDSMGALAAYKDPLDLEMKIPSMSNLVGYWIDIARLYTILGQETYQATSKHCKTASELVRLVDGDNLDDDSKKIKEALAAEGVVNLPEVSRIIKATFMNQRK